MKNSSHFPIAPMGLRSAHMWKKTPKQKTLIFIMVDYLSRILNTPQGL